MLLDEVELVLVVEEMKELVWVVEVVVKVRVVRRMRCIVRFVGGDGC